MNDKFRTCNERHRQTRPCVYPPNVSGCYCRRLLRAAPQAEVTAPQRRASATHQAG